MRALDEIRTERASRPLVSRATVGAAAILVFAAILASGASAKDVVAKINFQPAWTETPSGFRADSGAAYSAVRGHGWVDYDGLGTPQNVAYATFVRNGGADLRVDTGIYLTPPRRSWGRFEVAVDPGVYDIWITVGDRGSASGHHVVLAEGQTVVDWAQTGGDRVRAFLVEEFAVVDGRLTLHAPVGADTSLLAMTVRVGDTTSGDVAAPVSPGTSPGTRLPPTTVPAPDRLVDDIEASFIGFGPDGPDFVSPDQPPPGGPLPIPDFDLGPLGIPVFDPATVHVPTPTAPPLTTPRVTTPTTGPVTTPTTPRVTTPTTGPVTTPRVTTPTTGPVTTPTTPRVTTPTTTGPVTTPTTARVTTPTTPAEPIPGLPGVPTPTTVKPPVTPTTVSGGVETPTTRAPTVTQPPSLPDQSPGTTPAPTTTSPPATTAPTAPPTTTSPGTGPPTTSSPATTAPANPVQRLVGDIAGIAPGGHFPYMDIADIRREMDLLAGSGARWLRMPFTWQGMQPQRDNYRFSKHAAIVDEAHKRGISIIANVSYTPQWARASNCNTWSCPPADPGEYATFVEALVHYFEPLGLTHYEIWNEPNMKMYWSPKPNPAAYAKLVRTTYQRVKPNHPNAVFIVGVTAPARDLDNGTQVNPVTFLDRTIRNGIIGSFDEYSHHPYVFPAAPEATPSWHGINSVVPQLYDLLRSNGERTAEVWATEIAWHTGTGRDGVSEQTQADYVTRTFRQWRKVSKAPLIWFSLRNLGTNPHDHDQNFGLRRKNWSAKPAWTAWVDTMNDRID